MTNRILITYIAAALATPALAQDAARGKETYMKAGCWECHGRAGQGGGYTGPKLAPDPPPLVAMQAYIRHPGGDMPPYSEKVLPNSAVADVRAFLLTLPRPPAAKTLPGLNK